MKNQVAKSQIFTKELLTRIQDKMRNCCIKSFNKVYEELKSDNILRQEDIEFIDNKNTKKEIMNCKTEGKNYDTKM